VMQSRCPWIAFCDSDDLWRTDKLLFHVMLHQAEPEVEYSFSDFAIVSDDRWSSTRKFDGAPFGYWEAGRAVVAQDCWVFRQNLYERLVVYQPIFPSSVFISRVQFDRLGGWNTSFDRKRIVDFEFHLRCVAVPPIGVVNRPTVGIRKHASNLSDNLINMLLGEIDVLRFALEHHPVARSYGETIRQSIARRQLNALDAAFVVKDFSLVRQLYREMADVRRAPKTTLKYAISLLPSTVRASLAHAFTHTRS
jgi:hypothetical protein